MAKSSKRKGGKREGRFCIFTPHMLLQRAFLDKEISEINTLKEELSHPCLVIHQTKRLFE